MTESPFPSKNQESKKSAAGDSSRSFWEMLTFGNRPRSIPRKAPTGSSSSVFEMSSPEHPHSTNSGEFSLEKNIGDETPDFKNIEIRHSPNSNGGNNVSRTRAGSSYNLTGGDNFFSRHVGGYVSFTSAAKSLARIIANSYKKEVLESSANSPPRSKSAGDNKGGETPAGDNTAPEDNGKLLKFTVALTDLYAKYFKKCGGTPAGEKVGGGGDPTAAEDGGKMLKFSEAFTLLYTEYFVCLGAFIKFTHKETGIIKEFFRVVLVLGLLFNAVFLFSFYLLFTRKIVKKARTQYSLNLLVIVIISLAVAGCYVKKDYRVYNVAGYLVEWIVSGIYIYRELY